MAFLQALKASALLPKNVRSVASVSGLMQDHPLSMLHLFWRAENLFKNKKVISHSFNGREETTYGEWALDVRKIPAVLDKLGISKGGRVGSFAWNNTSHLTLWYGVPCAGRILHTLNIRLFPEQLSYIANHAEDEVIFVDRSLLPLMLPHFDNLPSVKHFVIVDDGKKDVPIPNHPKVLMFDDVMNSVQPGDLAKVNENDACGMCYTSGTTGHPKGVVYTHRSSYLHTMCVGLAEVIGLTERDTVLPVVPMFHANAWGLSHAAPAFGSDLVMPGPFLQPKPLADMLEKEKVTITAGVPTIWMGLLHELDNRDLTSLRMIACGGSAVPKALSKAFRNKIGLPIKQAWGMTETSPIGSACAIRSSDDHLNEDAKDDIRASAGTPVFGVEVRIVDEGVEQPWDGKATGELQIRGPWVANAYYNRPDATDCFTSDGFLKTGDVAAISPDAFISFTDRTKDLIKTGGEWISSVEVENEIMEHPKVKEAAVIAAKSEKWMERPLACVVLKDAADTFTHEELVEFLAPRMAKWWLPDDIRILDEIPKTSVGKFSKKDLREMLKDVVLP